MKISRCSGILLHPTSLPSRFGVGDFGKEAFHFAEQLSASGQTIWQMLPIGPAGYANSPYQALSAFAGEPLLISLENLVQRGYLEPADLEDAPAFPHETIDYDAVRAWKIPLLAKAARNFLSSAQGDDPEQFQRFCSANAHWLEDYAMFAVLRSQFPGRSWVDWDRGLANRDPQELSKVRRELHAEMESQKYWQFEFYRQWSALRDFCKRRGLLLMGDLPIYVSHESADVWAHRDQFCLDRRGNPSFVAGVPPDYFSQTGQLWGNPIYRWSAMQRQGFTWWIERFRNIFHLFDIVRVDHFRGFEAYWSVPAGEKTAVNGKWMKAPGRKLFRKLSQSLGELNVVAENLGVITNEVEELRREFGFPGMAVLQFAFGSDPQAATFRPHNFERHVFAYTGTHDNDTIMGWWNSGSGNSTRSHEETEQEKIAVRRYLGPHHEPLNWSFIRLLYASVADVVIIPMQDVLGLGSEARMNLPGSDNGNWRWRMLPGAFAPSLEAQLRELAEIYERIPHHPATES